jgi:hypothetical protein
MMWTFDEDEAIPFPSDIVSGGRTLLPSPAEPIAGVCQTTRISGLPHCYCNELDDTSKISVHVHAINKQKAPPSNDLDNCQHVTCKLKTDLVQDASADGTITEVATEPADDDYQSFKDMADADHQVHWLLPSFSNSAHNKSRQWSTDPGKSIQLMYVSFSVVTKDIYIQSREKSWMDIGAWSVGKYLNFLCLFYFTNSYCVKG